MSEQSPTSRNEPLPGFNSLFLPLILLEVALLAALILPTLRGVAEHKALNERIHQQEATLVSAHNLRQKADSLFSKMQGLADNGNPIAQQVVGALRQRGLTINAKQATPLPPR